MLASALGALSDRFDAKILTAYWLPAFVAALGGLAVLTALVGAERIEAWVFGLDSVEQTLAVLLVVLTITMLAFVLRALTRPVAALFAGDALPQSVAEWSTRGQRRGKQRETADSASELQQPGVPSSPATVRRLLNRDYPLNDGDLRPTLFGNVLATATEYPRLTYSMEGLLWWPRLSPLLPIEFQEMLSGAMAPMVALLNLSVVFTALAVGGAVALGFVGDHWPAMIATLGGGLLLARLFYWAAVSQAAEVATQLRVGFDLYRHEILRQMDLEVPTEIEAERALWARVSAELLEHLSGSSPGDR